MGINHTKYLVLMSLMTQYDSKTGNQFTTIEFYDNLAACDALITLIRESIKEIDNVKLIQLFKARY